MSAVQAICSFQLLVSTALVAKILATYQEEREVRGRILSSQCEKWDKEENREYEYTCGQLTGGVVSKKLSGYILTFLNLFNIFYEIKRVKSGMYTITHACVTAIL
jgi:hypothetical protein